MGSMEMLSRRLGLLAAIFVATWGAAAPAGAQTVSVTRVMAYDYDSVGNLTKEIVEPDLADLCLATTYGYDSYGNRTTTTRRNCNGAMGSVPGVNSEAAAPTGSARFTERSDVTEYSGSDAPRFPNAQRNALSHRTTLTFHHKFGTQLQSRDAITSSAAGIVMNSAV